MLRKTIFRGQKKRERLANNQSRRKMSWKPKDKKV